MKSPNKMMGSIAGAIGGNTNLFGGRGSIGAAGTMAQAAARAAARTSGQNTAGSIIGGTMGGQLAGTFNPATMGMQPPTELSPEEQERESLRMYGSGAGDLDVFGNLKNGINSDFSKSVQDDQLEYEENLTPTTPTMAENEAKLRNPIGKELQPMNAINMENKGESGQLNTFSDQTNQVASQALGKMFSTPVALKTNTPIKMKTNPGSAYSAMDALKSHYDSRQNLNLSKSFPGSQLAQTNNANKSLALPALPTSSTGSGGMTGMGGSYSNPASTGAGTTVNTPPASSTPQYSFLTDQNTPTFDKSKLDNPEHRMSFLGLYKRNAKSLEARMTDAKLNGRTKKYDRLNKKLTNFTNNQKNSDNFLQRTGKKIGSLFS